MKKFKIKHVLIVYYIFLLLLLLLKTNTDAPNPIYRLAYLTLFFLPLVLRYRYAFLPLFICFMTIGTYGFSYSFFPYMMVNYAMISIIALCFSKDIPKTKVDPLWFCTILYIGFVDILNSGSFADIFYSLLTASISVILTKKADSRIVKRLMLLSFTVISISLSLQYLINYDLFVESYNASDGVERAGWTDPNYLSCIIGMGILSSVILLTDIESIRPSLKIYCIAVILISIVSQVLLASRGGLLCVSMSLITIVIFSKIKKYYKLLAVLFALLFIIWLYNNSYFDLLLYRMGEDTTGSGRLGIWNRKLTAFSSECTPINWFFGLGQQSAYQLASTGNGVGFHNDFIAILCSYGLVGVVLFIYILFIYPFKLTDQLNRVKVWSIVIYLTLACLTLEPFAAGRITYFGFYALILFCSREKSTI